jgi:hypothetical protein
VEGIGFPRSREDRGSGRFTSITYVMATSCAIIRLLRLLRPCQNFALSTGLSQASTLTGAILHFHDQPIALDVNVRRPPGLRKGSDLGRRSVTRTPGPSPRKRLTADLRAPGVHPWATPAVNRIDLTAVLGNGRASRSASATGLACLAGRSPLRLVDNWPGQLPANWLVTCRTETLTLVTCSLRRDPPVTNCSAHASS